MFCNVIYEDGRHELLIRSTLVKDTLDLRGEYVLLFAQDMTSIRKIEEANRQLMLTSRHDKLTGLLNRAAAEKLISEHLDLVGASSSYCFLLLDIDYFKSVNDRFGHLAGTRSCNTWAVPCGILPVRRCVCRWGGDEFDFFFAASDLAKSCVKGWMPCAPGCLIAVRRRAFVRDPEHWRRVRKRPILACGSHSKADKALYQVKQQGRTEPCWNNCVEAFGNGLKTPFFGERILINHSNGRFMNGL